MISPAIADLFVASVALVAMVVLGTVAHELCHATILRMLDVPHDVHWLPDRRSTGLGGSFGRWAVVVPRRIPDGLSPWGLRLAALSPLALATPMALVLFGVLPDPLATGDLVLSAASIGWIACAIPSPKDFSLVWYAREVVESNDLSTLSGPDGA